MSFTMTSFLSSHALLTLAIAWLAFSTLYPTFTRLPVQPKVREWAKVQPPQCPPEQIQNQVVSECPILPTVEEVCSPLLAEVESMRVVLKSYEAQLQVAIDSVNAHHKAVETIVCPSVPEYVMDAATTAQLDEIVRRHNQIIADQNIIAEKVQAIVEVPRTVLTCPSIEQSTIAMEEKVNNAMIAVHSTEERIAQLVEAGRISNHQWTQQMESVEAELKKAHISLQSAADADAQAAHAAGELKKRFFSFTSQLNQLLKQERDKYQELLHRPPPEPVVVPCEAPEPCVASISDEVVEKHVQEALGDLVKDALPELEQSLQREVHENLDTWKRSVEQKWDSHQRDLESKLRAELQEARDKDQQIPKNFALSTGGARVVRTLTSPTFIPEQYRIGAQLKSLFHGTRLEKMMPASDGHAIYDTLNIEVGAGGVYEALTSNNRKGHCWAMKGSQGNFTVELLAPISVQSITLHHLTPAVGEVPATSALNDFRVFSAEDDSMHWRLLGAGQYKASLGGSQHFRVKHLPNPARFVRLEILSNHGNADYTCLYQLAVHDSS